MKKLLSLTLAIIMLAAALASCAGVPSASPNANIRLTSSDAKDAAEWLSDRLGDRLTGRVVIGTDADGYGVDVTALEADGYFIRSLGDEVALFARTTDGLDRAVRKYAKSVESGAAIEDEVFHEGYRVEELRLAGIDVSSYAIRVEGESEYIKNWVTANAAETFAALIKIACGAEIAVGSEAEHEIVFRQIADGSFKESSYHYFFDGADLIFEYTDLAGARNAFVKFLENECGWDDLYYGFDVLREADLVDVPADTDVLCHPRFGGFRLTTFGSFKSNTMYCVNAGSFTYKYRIDSAHHYVGRVWGSEYGVERTGTMICLTDDYVLEDVVEQLSASAAASIASGEKIGEDLAFFNLGMEDANSWCSCKECQKLYRAEGFTWAGPMVYFANRVDDAMDELGFEGLKYPIFAYAGSNRPPKSAPHDDVYVTFVFDMSCTNHCLDTSQCGWAGKYTSYAQDHMGEWLRGWCELAAHVYARPAPLLSPMHAPVIIDQTYDDIKFFTEIGVECVYDEIYTCREFDTNLIVSELWDSMNFAPEMSRAEFCEEVGRLCEKYYGDGWRGVLDYLTCLERAELESPYCWSAWNTFLELSDPHQFDHATYAALWDRMLASLEYAEREANTAEQETRVAKLRIVALYCGCYASYYYAYNDGDDGRIAMLEERWAQMMEIAKDIGLYEEFRRGISPYGFWPEYSGVLLFDTLEETAWKGAWTLIHHSYYEIMRLAGIQSPRPTPEKYADRKN